MSCLWVLLKVQCPQQRQKQHFFNKSPLSIQENCHIGCERVKNASGWSEGDEGSKVGARARAGRMQAGVRRFLLPVLLKRPAQPPRYSFPRAVRATASRPTRPPQPPTRRPLGRTFTLVQKNDTAAGQYPRHAIKKHHNSNPSCFCHFFCKFLTLLCSRALVSS